MFVVFLTALPMTLLRPNLFLFGVAVVSFYFALSGWLRARNRGDAPILADWVAATAMASVAAVMSLRAIALIRSGDPKGTALLAFGVVGEMLALRDIRFFRSGRYHGAARIQNHLSRMLGGTAAVLTAFTVTVLKVRTEPAFLAWLLPSVIIVPISVYWSRRILRPVPDPAKPAAAHPNP
jgi:hypothetical protein